MNRAQFERRTCESTVSQDVRESNKRIARKALQLRFVSAVPFICECSDPDCREFMLLHPHEYTERSESGYVALPGHRSDPAGTGRSSNAVGDGSRES